MKLNIRLQEFTCHHFKNFLSPTTIDFSHVGTYKFNQDCVKDSLLKNVVVYGKNAIGKTNLGLALFDITYHLVDKARLKKMEMFYLNADEPSQPACFQYKFKLKLSDGAKYITYRYHKVTPYVLLDETLLIDEKPVFFYSFREQTGDLSHLSDFGLASLNWQFRENGMSILRYIANNMSLPENHPIMELMRFVNGMLWFCSLGNGNDYMGLSTRVDNMPEYIGQHGYVGEFEAFLHEYGVEEQLTTMLNDEGKEVLAFAHQAPVPFYMSSSGTAALTTVFYWLKQEQKPTFVFIDEFDAFYHFELAEKVVKLLVSQEFQSVLTTHNTDLMTNALLRPDCYLLMTKDHITALPDATQRELRQGHSLEQLYRHGEFDE